jgi:integrase
MSGALTALRVSPVLLRNVLNLPWDACVQSARHTALTNLGLTGVDPFTLQRVAGHANITTTRAVRSSDAADNEGRIQGEGSE